MVLAINFHGHHGLNNLRAVLVERVRFWHFAHRSDALPLRPVDGVQQRHLGNEPFQSAAGLLLELLGRDAAADDQLGQVAHGLDTLNPAIQLVALARLGRHLGTRRMRYGGRERLLNGLVLGQRPNFAQGAICNVVIAQGLVHFRGLLAPAWWQGFAEVVQLARRSLLRCAGGGALCRCINRHHPFLESVALAGDGPAFDAYAPIELTLNRSDP